jgi:uncharacterized delta-60 repeat protein
MGSSRWLWRSPFVVCALATVGAFASCVGEDVATSNAVAANGDSGSVDGPSDAGTSASSDAADASEAATLELKPSRPLVVRGGNAAVEVKLTRRGLGGDVSVSAAGLPAGVTMEDVTIPSASSTATITFVATSAAKMGNASVTLKAAGAQDLKFELVVGGTPGVLDESFDNDGIVLDTAAATGSYLAVARQPDGKLLAVGTKNFPNGGWLIRRFDASGAPDAAFNDAAATVAPATGAAHGLALDPSTGRIVVVGGSGSTERVTILRLNADGTADEAFANAGTMVADSVAHPQGSVANAVVVLPDSAIVVAGKKNPTALVERYTGTGIRDNDFVIYTSADAANLTGLAVLPSGAFVASGTDENASPDAQLVVRLLQNGTPDGTFAGGTRTYASGCRGYALGIASSGDAIIVGDDQTSPIACITRIQASGKGDLVYTQSVGGGSGAKFYGAAAGPNDTTYAAAQITGTYDNAARIERRLSDGGLDSTFGTSGVVTLEDPATPDTYKFIPSALMTVDSRLIVVGRRTAPTSGPPFILRIWE